MAVATRRLKFWGWGYEDQQPSHEEVREAAAGIRAHLGLDPAEPEQPVAVEDLKLPRAAAEPPAVARRDLLVRPLRARAAHAYGKATATSCGRSAGQFEHAPGRGRAARARRRRSRRCSTGAPTPAPRRSRSAAARAWSAASSRAWATATPARSRSTCASSTACWRSTPSRGPRGSRRARPAPRSRPQLREHGLTLRHFPQSFEYSTLGGWIATRAGGHFATRLHAHRRPRRVGARDHPARASGRPGGCPGSGAGPSPDRLLLGSEGILGVITEAWMRVQAAAALAVVGVVPFETFEAGAAAVRALSQSGLYPSNCRLLDPGEAALDRRRAATARRCSCSASSPPTTRSSRGWTARSSCARDHGGALPRRRAAPRPGAEGERAEGERRVARRRSCRRPTCATR